MTEEEEHAQFARRIRENQEKRWLEILAERCPRCELGSETQRACWGRGMERCKLREEIEVHQKLVELRQACERANVPNGFRALMLEDYRITLEDYRRPLTCGLPARPIDHECAAFNAIFDEEPWRLQILSGPPGSGKSLAAAHYVARMFGGGGLFLHAPRLNVYSDEITGLMEAALEAPALALDDVGSGGSTKEVAAQRIEELICTRWDEDLDTIVTTNLVEDRFWELYGGRDGRIADRVYSDEGRWVYCLEQSRRRRQGSKPLRAI